MQQKTLLPKGDDSDNDQGFVAHAIEIKHKETSKITVLNVKPDDYQPRFINGSCLLKKELSQLVNTYPHFTKEQPVVSSKISHKKQRQAYNKIEQQTFPNKNYQLVYQRSTKSSQFQSINTQNNVSLTSIVSYSAENYSILKAWEINKSNNEDLVFQSRFQCGNLHSAYKSLSKQNHYILFLQNDTNTKGYNKWFYFAVRNKHKAQTYTISIVNFRKNFDFVKEGMKVTRFSQKENEMNGIGWTKCGTNIHMYRSKLQNLNEANFNQNYTLTFQVTFQYQNDVNFFSLLPPYSYTKLINFLNQSKKINNKRDDIRFQYITISYSISNTQVPYVVISGKEQSKKNILVLARQHPGQVWSSFFVESFMKELLRDQFQQKQWLLKQYTFRIFPMINVDGVIYGNFRCDLTGMDLNRCWKQPNKLLHPHLCAIKQEITRLSKEEQIVCCLDLHAHSKQHNIFAYSCKTDSQARMLPLLISRMSNMFYFPSCTYGVSKYKQTTARAVVYDISRAPDVLTIESSFYAGNNPFKTITPSIYIAFSNAVLKALKYYYHRGKEFKEAEQALPKVMADIALMRAKNKNKYELDEQSGSDSEPECDEIAITEKLGKILPKCTVVEVALGLVSEEKKKKQENMPKIKQDKPKKPQKDSKIVDLRLQNISKSKTIQQSLTRKKVDSSPLSITRPSFTNKRSIKSKLNKSQKKQVSQSLPKTIQQKPEIQCNAKFNYKLSNNESLQFPPRKTSNLKKFMANEFHSTFKQKQYSKYQIEYKYQKRQEEDFPLLCVLSQRKKQAHLQKMKRIHPPQPQKEKPIVRYQPTMVINKKLDTMQKLRERQKHSSDLVSALWKQTLGYELDGPTMRIFS